MQAGIVGMRAQFRHWAQQDLRRHRGERYRIIRFGKVDLLRGWGPAIANIP
jgi:hypothetical protein